METINFWRVKIGKVAKSGNMQVFHDFMVKTNMIYEDLYQKTRKQYSGFDISIENVVIIDIIEEKPKEEKPGYKLPKVEKIYKMEADLRITNFDEEIKNQWDNLYEEKRILTEKIKEFYISLGKIISNKIINVGYLSGYNRKENIERFINEDFSYEKVSYTIYFEKPIETILKDITENAD